jgi:nucleotide-binding universal stress UspA family protein
MYKHIGVGLDGSPYAATAETLAIELAKRMKATVHGVHVIDASFIEGAFITDISGAMGFEPFLNLQAQMRETLQDFARVIQGRFTDRCEEEGVPAFFHVKRMGVVHGILEATKLVDLLVIGQRGVNAKFHEDLLGPTTEVLLRRSPVPLLVVPEQAELPRRPAAAYDGSVKAARALHYAAEACRQLSLPLTVVTVDDRDDRARGRLDEAAGYLAPHGVEATFRHERGEAVEQVLLSLLGGEGYDLVFLGAHGHHRIVELVMGSTTEYLTRRSPVPVFCVTQP